ncbi:MAG TPA: hypothetical protein VGH51_04245 [Candidatus Angelobacter sp.]
MGKIPFSVYDFFAYLPSGIVLIAIGDYVMHLGLAGREKVGSLMVIGLLVIAYVLGQVVAHLSSFIFEETLIARLLKKPSLILLGDGGYPNTPVDYAGVELTTFWNSYPEFTDTNNLSVVSFLQYGGSSICVTGDLERAGWESLLLRSDFREHLHSVNIFIASHHGRISGYCERVFDYCNPAIILISDKEMVYESQKCDYAKHASGITWNGSNGKTICAYDKMRRTYADY